MKQGIDCTMFYRREKGIGITSVLLFLSKRYRFWWIINKVT